MCVKNAMLEELITLEVPLPSARRQLSPLPSRRIINPSFKARHGERGDQAPPGTARNARVLRTHAPTRHARPPADARPRTRTPRTLRHSHEPRLAGPALSPTPHSPPQEHVSPETRQADRGRREPTRGGCPAGRGIERGDRAWAPRPPLPRTAARPRGKPHFPSPPRAPHGRGGVWEC